MKTVTAAIVISGFFASLASADVRVDEAVKLQQDGSIKPFEELNELAIKQHPGASIRDTELDDHHGTYIYEVELRDADGQKWDVDLDASTGEILQDKQDD
ncbi:MAG: PepSY domain-containing protein [Halioglobus sp.]|nr:PepSY domain-containing protein [Halioglobus sp.]